MEKGCWNHTNVLPQPLVRKPQTPTQPDMMHSPWLTWLEEQATSKRRIEVLLYTCVYSRNHASIEKFISRLVVIHRDTLRLTAGTLVLKKEIEKPIWSSNLIKSVEKRSLRYNWLVETQQEKTLSWEKKYMYEEIKGDSKSILDTSANRIAVQTEYLPVRI